MANLLQRALRCSLLSLGIWSVALPQNSEDFERLLGLLAAAEPEYQADGWLRLVERKVAPRDRRGELLDRAWLVAGLAQQPTERREWWRHSDSLSGALANASFARIDTLSIQGRVVEAWFRIDRRRALEYFERIVYPDLTVTPCHADLVPTFDRHYRLVELLADGAFSPADRTDERHVAFVESRIRRMRSPAELGPALRTIAAGSFAADARRRLTQSLVAQLPALLVDYPAFTTGAAEVLDGLAALVSALPPGDPTALLLAKALRGTLVSQLSGARCTGPKDYGEARRSHPARILREFREQTARFAREGVQPIEDREIRTEFEATPQLRLAPFSSSESASTSRRIEELRASVPRHPAAEGRWNLLFHEVLASLVERRPPDGERRVSFAESVWFLKSLDSIPADQKQPSNRYEHSGRERIPGVLVSLLTGSLGADVRREDRNLWYWGAVETIEVAARLSPRQRAEMNETVRQSRDPYLLFHAALSESARVDSPSPPWVR